MDIKSYWETWAETTNEFRIQISGTGTIEDPMILVPRCYWNNNYFSLEISDSKKYIEIKKINLKSLHLSNCKNVKILDSTIKNLDLKKCSKFCVKNLDIKKLLSLSNCQEIKFSRCYIKKIFAISSKQILLSQCVLKRVARKSEAKITILDENLTQFLENKSTQSPNKVELDIWICEQCDSEIDMFSIFCPECGNRLK